MRCEPDPTKIVNMRGETRQQLRDRSEETIKRLAAVLIETAASYDEVDYFFTKAKGRLCVTGFPGPED